MAQESQALALVDPNRLDLEVSAAYGRPSGAPGEARRRLAPDDAPVSQHDRGGLLTRSREGGRLPWERLRYEHTQMIRARLASGTHRATPTRCSPRSEASSRSAGGSGSWTSRRYTVRATWTRSQQTTPDRKALTEDTGRPLMHATSLRDRTLIRFIAWTGLRRTKWPA